MSNIILDSIAKVFSKKETTENLIEELKKDKEILNELLRDINSINHCHKLAYEKSKEIEPRFQIFKSLKVLVEQMSNTIIKIKEHTPKKIDFQYIKEHEEEISKFKEDYKKLINDINKENENHREIFNEIETKKKFEEKEKKLKLILDKSLIIDDKIIKDLNNLNADINIFLEILNKIAQNSENQIFFKKNEIKNDLENSENKISEINTIKEKIEGIIKQLNKNNFNVYSTNNGTTLKNNEIINDYNLLYKVLNFESKSVNLEIIPEEIEKYEEYYKYHKILFFRNDYEYNNKENKLIEENIDPDTLINGLDSLVIKRFEMNKENYDLDIEEGNSWMINFTIYMRLVHEFSTDFPQNEKWYKLFPIDVFGDEDYNGNKTKITFDGVDYQGKHFAGTPKKDKNRNPKSRTLHKSGEELCLDVKKEIINIFRNPTARNQNYLKLTIINSNIIQMLNKAINNKSSMKIPMTFYHNHTKHPELNEILFDRFDTKIKSLPFGNDEQFVFEKKFFILHATPTKDNYGISQQSKTQSSASAPTSHKQTPANKP